MESLLQDVLYGFRAMRRSPAFSLVVILTLALGIGLNTAIFSVVDTVLLKPLPYPDSERLVWFGESTGRAEGISVTWGNFTHWRDSNHSFEAMAAFQFTELTLTGRNEPLVTRGLVATTPYFALLGMRPLLGRLLDDSDDRPGAEPALVLNHHFWASQLGGDPNVVGKTLTLSGRPYVVAGVAAPLWETWRVDYYLSLGRLTGNNVDRSRHGSIRMLGRLKPGVTLAAARADLDAIMRHLAEVDPGSENEHRSFGRFFAEYATGDVRGTLFVLMGAAALILLIACANVASLLLARNTARASELALRKAIGAGRLRLVRQLLTESVLVAAVGGLAGIVLAYGTLRTLVALAPRDIPRLAETALDVPVLLFACAITLASGLIAGLAPVITAGKLDLMTVLKEGARLSGGGRHRQSLRNVLVVAEVALTFVLAFGSGLLVRSLMAAQNSGPGFEPRHALSFRLQLPSAAYHSPEAIADFYAGLLADLRALPGVAAASAVHCPPGAGDCGDWFYSIPGRPVPAQNEVPIALFNTADAGYFEILRIPLRQGREFNGADRANGPKVVIVNETFARTWWPAESAIGHQIKFGGPYQEGPLLEVIGVAGDAKQMGLDSPPMPEIYQPFSQQRGGDMAIVIRVAGDAEALRPAVRARVLAHDRNLPLRAFATFERAFGAGLARRRFATLLLTMFAGLAMVLAAIGIYGLLNYWVSVRESEIALRLALGARPSTILRWTSFHALRLATIGIAFGVLGGWVAARGLEELVFGIPSRNPATMIAAALAVGAIAVAAAALPSWRAARVDAARRLHYA
ncbi:conserved membrane hypothetical protein [Candidatus Sulfopaludibacter sp. SbA6]|nr:conserved membrane hypothetical protein [Candidatus Sulfopaludibacter sp. SbA6]